MHLLRGARRQRETAEPGLPQLTTGEFIAFNAAYGLFLAAMQALGDASLNLLRIVPIYERLVPILDADAGSRSLEGASRAS